MRNQKVQRSGHRTPGFVFGTNGVPMMRTGASVGCSTRVAASVVLAVCGLVSKTLTATANTTQNSVTNDEQFAVVVFVAHDTSNALPSLRVPWRSLKRSKVLTTAPR